MIINGNALSLPLADEGVQCAVTSPPYWGLRSYLDTDNVLKSHELGCEPTPDEYVAKMVAVFREVKRVLRNDGTVWLNLGDSYAGSGRGPTGHNGIGNQEHRQGFVGHGAVVPAGLKPKDLVGIPWRVAFALQADGWYLRSDIIFAKKNPMPESVKDRPTRSHEYVFLLTKNARYYYDARAIAEPSAQIGKTHIRFGGNKYGDNDAYPTMSGDEYTDNGTRNKRDVWTMSTRGFRGAHFAVMPEALVEPCILAGSKPGDVVLDPFSGAGTVGLVASRLGRRHIGVELSLEYCTMADQRIYEDAPLLSGIACTP